jgi:hypothetical protein
MERVAGKNFRALARLYLSWFISPEATEAAEEQSDTCIPELSSSLNRLSLATPSCPDMGGPRPRGPLCRLPHGHAYCSGNDPPRRDQRHRPLTVSFEEMGTSVLLFGEFHIPKRATIGTALGLLDQPARVPQLDKMQSPNTSPRRASSASGFSQIIPKERTSERKPR